MSDLPARSASPLVVLAPVATLLLSVALLLSGHGLQTTLVPLRGALEHFSAFSLGLIGSGYYVGFVTGCLIGPRLVVRVGHIRVFTALVAAASAAALVHALAVDPFVWIALRIVTGMCMAGLYLVIESWLNEHATNETRGLVMSAYIVVNFSMITLGQLLITQASPTGFALFTLASILVSVAAIPVALTNAAQPAPIAVVSFRPRRLIGISPVGLIGAFVVGIANGAFWGLGPVFAARADLGADGVAIFMSAAVLGGALMQYPVGRMSDFLDRRIVLAGMLVLAALSGIAIAILPVSGTALLALALVFGALTLPGYAISAAHAYDHTERSGYVEMAAGLLLFNGAGSIIGPLAASLAMDHFGGKSLFVFTAVTQTLLALFVVWRMRQRAAVAPADKTEFDMAATAPVGGAISLEVPDLDEDNIVLPDRLDVPAEVVDLDTLMGEVLDDDPHPEQPEQPRQRNGDAP
ncbi:MAG: MFS transporter [Hyphomicrobiaceae bacterium]|nr:MFS transporter [Hyphomicrobiaceae bacterium]